MAFPTTPTDGQIYVSMQGRIYKYTTTLGSWKQDTSLYTSSVLTAAGFTPANGRPRRYLDSTVTPNKSMEWNGTAYIPTSMQYAWGYGYESSVAPISPTIGVRWMDTSTFNAPLLKFWNGTIWTTTSGGSISYGDEFYASNNSRTWVFSSVYNQWVPKDTELRASLTKLSALTVAPALSRPPAYWDDVNTSPAILRVWNDAASAYQPAFSQYRYGIGFDTATAPGSPTIGTHWLDETTPSARRLKYWNGTTWITISTSEHTAGDMYYATATQIKWQWDGTNWVNPAAGAGDIDIFNYSNVSPVTTNGFGPPVLLQAIPINTYYKLDLAYFAFPIGGLGNPFFLQATIGDLGGAGNWSNNAPVLGNRGGFNEWYVNNYAIGNQILYSQNPTTISQQLELWATGNAGTTCAPGDIRITVFATKKKTGYFRYN